MAKKASGRRVGGGLSRLSISELQAEMSRRTRLLRGLVRRRERLADKLARLDAQIESLGGAVDGGGGTRGRRGGGARPARRRPRNEMNLVEALRQLLAGKTMSVTEAAEAVQNAGYKTTSSSFRTIVNQTLINSGAFKKVARGQYTAK
ncbi:MAG TPA: hypothetical protein VD963_02535 [Phycisphaerales bacterium]|nr:hypothetical protein [Phycisphaerales bacterium]